MSTHLLQQKNAVIFGAGGSIGAAVAKEFALQGARVYLAGRAGASLDAVTKQIVATGGKAESTVIDTLDDTAVSQYMNEVARRAGRIDVAVDLAGPRAREYGNGKNALDLSVDEFMIPMGAMVRSRFITARAAARHMAEQHAGVIIFVTGSPVRPHVPGATAIGAAFAAMENLTMNLAFELSPLGVRVVCLRTLANFDSRSIQDTIALKEVYKDQAKARFEQSNFLRTLCTVQDTANAAVLIASDRARMLTGTVVNATAGSALD